MFSIGDFARFGRVSVRSLRHYDALGLLTPASVDPATGYRLYAAEQLARLNRIIALKDLGFTLRQVADMIDGKLATSELEGMLRLRRAELEAGVAADLDRLARIETRISLIQNEGLLPANEILVKRVPRLRVIELSVTASGYESDAVAPVVVPLFEQLHRRLEAARLVPGDGPMMAYYEPDSDGVSIHAALPAAADVRPDDAAAAGLALVDLPEIDVAALVHRGSMDRVDGVWQEIAGWLDNHAYRTTDNARELYLECPGGGEAQVTEWHKANALVPEIYEWLARNGIEPGGGPIYRYRVMGDNDREFDLEVAVPVAGPIQGDGRVRAGTLPAGPYAVLIHQGHPDRQEQSHAALQEWAAAQGLALDKAGEGRDAVWAARCETYLTDPAEQPDPEQWSTELAYLIKES